MKVYLKRISDEFNRMRIFTFCVIIYLTHKNFLHENHDLLLNYESSYDNKVG